MSSHAWSPVVDKELPAGWSAHVSSAGWYTYVYMPVSATSRGCAATIDWEHRTFRYGGNVMRGPKAMGEIVFRGKGWRMRLLRWLVLSMMENA